MSRSETRPRLIGSTPTAAVAFALTAIVATTDFRSVFLHPGHHRRWLFPVFFAQPRWLFLAIQLAFYAYLLWLCFVLFRRAKGKERIIVAGWSAAILLGPIQTFLSTRTASLLDYAEAFGMLAATFCALDILIRRREPAHDQDQP